MVKKIIILSIIFMAIFVPISNAISIDEIISQGDNFIDEGKNNQTVTEYDEHGNKVPKQDENGNNVTILNQKQLQKTVNEIYNILLTLGVGISVIIGAVLGIKYMVSTVEEQAKIKETLVPYAIGCFVVFGAFGIWKFIINMGQNIF